MNSVSYLHNMNKRYVILSQFGKVLRKYRLNSGVSQEEFAKVLGLHRTYLGAIERGERNLSLIKVYGISKSLNIRLTELFQNIRLPT